MPNIDPGIGAVPVIIWEEIWAEFHTAATVYMSYSVPSETIFLSIFLDHEKMTGDIQRKLKEKGYDLILSWESDSETLHCEYKCALNFPKSCAFGMDLANFLLFGQLESPVRNDLPAIFSGPESLPSLLSTGDFSRRKH